METDEDEQTLAVFMEALEQAQTMDRTGVWNRAAEQFDTDRIMDDVLTALQTDRLGWSIQAGPRI